MKSILLVLLTGLMMLGAQDPSPPKPTSQHAWLAKFIGSWDTKLEIVLPNGQAPVQTTMTETAKSLGGFWIVSESTGEFAGAPFSGQMTIGYDAPKNEFIGTWVDSSNGQMMRYKGKLEEDGKTLKLRTSGFCMLRQRQCEFKETIVFEDDTHRSFTTMVKNTEGKWELAMKGTAVKKS
jgi:hypothetical protein